MLACEPPLQSPAMLASRALLQVLRLTEASAWEPLANDVIEHQAGELAKRFVGACEALPRALIGEGFGSPMWLWQAQEHGHFDGEWVGGFSLIKVDNLATPADSPIDGPITALLFPGMKLTLDLMASSGPRGRPASLHLGITVCGFAEMGVAQSFLISEDEEMSIAAAGIHLAVYQASNPADGVHNPASLVQAFTRVAEGAAVDAEASVLPSSVPTAVSIEWVIDPSVSETDLSALLTRAGFFFRETSRALIYC